MPNILYFVFISECVESVLQFGRFFSSRKFVFDFFLIFSTCSDVVGWKVKLPRYTVPVVPYLQKDAGVFTGDSATKVPQKLVDL